MTHPRIGTPRQNTCIDCGQPFTARTHKAERCPICQHKRNAYMAAECQRRNYAKKRANQQAKRAEEKAARQTGEAKWRCGRNPKYKLIFDPSGDYTLGACFDMSSLPGSIATNYEAWEIGTRWTDGKSIFEYKRHGERIEKVTV